MMSEHAYDIGAVCKAAAEASRRLAFASTAAKDKFLTSLAGRLEADASRLQEANDRDIRAAREAGLAEALIDRLALRDSRIASMAQAAREIAALRDPVGEVVEGWTRPNGLRIEKVRTPIGVVGFIYESRPNVTTDAAALCVKSGNAVILRGGKEAINSNVAIAESIREALAVSGLPKQSVQVVSTTDRAAVHELLRADKYVDLIVPRGGKELIRAVVENSTVPVIKHYEGICHVYVDEAADLDMAEQIAVNAKVQRPSVCNAMETLLVHKNVARAFLSRVLGALREHKVQLRGCEKTRELAAEVPVEPATEEDWTAEYLDLILSIRVVDSLDEAIEHIERYGSRHSDAIVTTDLRAADRFVREVDSANVFVNASTRFSDGGEYGLGAEIGISTDKLHARGPMGLKELTTYKWIVRGNGHLRQ